MLLIILLFYTFELPFIWSRAIDASQPHVEMHRSHAPYLLKLQPASVQRAASPGREPGSSGIEPNHKAEPAHRWQMAAVATMSASEVANTVTITSAAGVLAMLDEPSVSLCGMPGPCTLPTLTQTKRIKTWSGGCTSCLARGRGVATAFTVGDAWPGVCAGSQVDGESQQQ